jgi:hypothetical protein
VPLVGFHDGSPDDDGESDKQNRFDDHVFNTFRPSIEDRPATVVNKIGASTRSDTINGRCDIFAASAHRLDQFEWREIGSVQREGTDKCLQSNEMSVARRPSRVLATDIIFDVGARSSFSATILVLVGLYGFTLSPCYRGTAARRRMLRFVLMRLCN